jgi:hypothetical protein
MGAIGGAFMAPAVENGFLATVGAGMAAGGTNAAIFGGDIGQGMLYGAIGAAAGFGLGQIGINNPYLDFGVQVAGGGLISGGIAELAGGKFSEGFAAGAVGSAMGHGIGKLMAKGDKTPAEQEKETESNLNTNKGTEAGEQTTQKQADETKYVCVFPQDYNPTSASQDNYWDWSPSKSWTEYDNKFKPMQSKELLQMWKNEINKMPKYPGMFRDLYRAIQPLIPLIP